jgi:Icc-related predicted phosphoesterase
LRLGIIADVHLSPPGTNASAFHTGYESPYTMAAYRLALRRCAKEDVDAVVLLGDLSQSGDAKPLETGVRLAAETGRRVWAVSGNHDCSERVDALEVAIRRVAADNVRLASPAGEVAEGEPRVAGLCVTSGSGGYKARSNGGRGAEDWGDEPAVWLSHYPMVYFAEEVTHASLIYGDDLEGLEEVARPLLARSAPTVVVSGHIHLRHACVAGKVLQLSCAALVEPPFEITLLDFEIDPQIRGDRIVVRRRSVPLISPSAVSCPVLSPPRQEWVFEAGEWSIASMARPQQEVAN